MRRWQLRSPPGRNSRFHGHQNRRLLQNRYPIQHPPSPVSLLRSRFLLRSRIRKTQNVPRFRPIPPQSPLVPSCWGVALLWTVDSYPILAAPTLEGLAPPGKLSANELSYPSSPSNECQSNGDGALTAQGPGARTQCTTQ